MNVRVILVVGLLFLFALTAGFMSYKYMGGPDLESAFNEGTVTLTLTSSAGEIPHTVNVENRGQTPIRVEQGTILVNERSEDLVIARDEVIPSNSSLLVPAYCIEPEVRAVKGVKLSPAGKAPLMIREVLSSSNPENPQDAFNTQLKVWVLARGDNLNIYRGEVYAAVKKRGMRFYQLRDNITLARSELTARYNLTQEELSIININSSALNRSSLFGLFQLLGTAND